jgi:nucleotide-binding universal stress UspA family protein
MFPRIKKILYATDLSKNSAYAFRYAANSAQKHDAEIHILHVIEPVPPPTKLSLSDLRGPEEVIKEYEKTKEDQIRRIDARIKEFARRELQKDQDTLKRIASIQVVIGNPAEIILKKIDELQADVLVLGKHGGSLFKQTFLGSVSNEVLLRLRKPVFVIPIPEEDTDMSMEEI